MPVFWCSEDHDCSSENRNFNRDLALTPVDGPAISGASLGAMELVLVGSVTICADREETSGIGLWGDGWSYGWTRGAAGVMEVCDDV